MIKNIKTFFFTALLGGVTVILPVAIFIMLIGWLMGKIFMMISPITTYLTTSSNIQEYLAKLIAIVILVLACFFIGLVARTKIGHLLVDFTDTYLLKKLPGYSLVKDTVTQLIGSKQTPFSKVALITLYGDQVRFTAFVTDEHVDGSYTVFIPTGPNPTSGNICHLPRESVEIVDVSVETAMKSVIGCGVGSRYLIEKSRRV